MHCRSTLQPLARPDSLQDPADGAITPRSNHPQGLQGLLGLVVTLLDGSVQVPPQLLEHLVGLLLGQQEDLQAFHGRATSLAAADEACGPYIGQQGSCTCVLDALELNQLPEAGR